MIRLFNVYYPIRTLILLVGEALLVATSLLMGTMCVNWQDSYLVLVHEHGYLKILAVTFLVLLASHLLDFFDTSRLFMKSELYFRSLMVPGLTALFLAAIAEFWPQGGLGLPATAIGVLILIFGLFGWQKSFERLTRLPILIEKVYVLGTDERAQLLEKGLRQNPEIGVEVASWTGKLEGAVTRESVAAHLLETVQKQKVHRVIVAMQDRRGTIPMQELLDLRMQGVKIEEATSWLEKISGKIEVENLYPSWIVFGQGFRRGGAFRFTRRVVSVVISLTGLILSLPLIPLIMLAIKLDSKGPVFYIQKRLGKNNQPFKLVKFRTMRQDAESATGPQWARNDDPRVTRVGRFLRTSRLDEIPQLWCVLKGDMAFVGPRPERPEFVEGVLKDIPFYRVRHMVRPGITGWAQIKYKYGSTVDDAREKLQYDLFYMKNASIGLDMMIMFLTIKTVILRRGAQ